MPEPGGGAGRPLAPKYLADQLLNPIPTGEGRLFPPITTGTPQIFSPFGIIDSNASDSNQIKRSPSN